MWRRAFVMVDRTIGRYEKSVAVVATSAKETAMQIEIRFRGLEPSDALRAHAVRRMHTHLGRFGHALGKVVVRIGDVNGPKGGVDKRCHITARGHRIATILVEELSTDAYAAVDMAAERIDRAVGRELARARTVRRDAA